MDIEDIDNFSERIGLMGQITALLNIEMQIAHQRLELEAKLAKLKAESSQVKA